MKRLIVTALIGATSCLAASCLPVAFAKDLATSTPPTIAVGGTLRMTGAVYRGKQPDDALTDLLMAELSGQVQVQVLARQQLRLVLDERALTAMMDDAARQRSLGRLLGVDVFAWVHVTADGATVEVVEAATGRGLATFHAAMDPKDPQPALKSLAVLAVEAARRAPPQLDPGVPLLAIAQAVLAEGGENFHDAVGKALLGLAKELEQRGVQKLHREFLKDLVLERWLADKEFTASQRKDLPMLGARYVLASRLEPPGTQLTLAILETATGRRVGQRSWPMDEVQDAKGQAQIAEWIIERIQPKAVARPRKPAAASPGKKQLPVQPEALAPLYQGVLLYNQGAYLDAAISFHQAALRDDRLLEPLVWIESCFDRAGFEEVREEYAKYIEKASKEPWNSASNPRVLYSEPGVAMAGLTADAAAPSALRVAVLMRAIDALHDATAAPVFVTADMAELRDEYDVLTGLDNVAGTTWRKSPPMLFTNTLTAHLEVGGAGPRLRLDVTHKLDPGRISAVTVELGADQAQWARPIAEACRNLLRAAPADRPAWRPPPAICLPDAGRFDWDGDIYALRYLKLVAGHPRQTVFLGYPQSPDPLANSVITGLHRWFLRTLGNDDPAKPLLDFAYASYYLPGQARLAAMERIEKTYPASGLAAIARLYALLNQSTLDNIAQTQADLERLLPVLKRCPPEMLSGDDVRRYVDANRLMRRALGLSDAEGKLHPAGQIWATRGSSHDVQLREVDSFPATLDYPGEVPARGKAIVDLAVLQCVWRREHCIPTELVKDLFTRFAGQPKVLAYFSVSYANKIFYCEGPDPQRAGILAELYPVHARFALDILARNPLPFNRSQVGDLIAANPSVDWAGQKLPAYRQARRQIRQAIMDGIEQGRFGKLNEADVVHLLNAAFDWGNRDAVPFLKKVADRSLHRDPLEDHLWLAYPMWDSWPTPAKKMEYYLPFYRRVRELHPSPAVNKSTAPLYFDFGLTFFRGGRLDLADENLSAVATFDDQDLKANSLYLLALIRQRQGNVPEALRLAQQAAEAARNGIGLIHWTGNGRGGSVSTSNLKSLANELTGKLRTNPSAPLKSPFGDP